MALSSQFAYPANRAVLAKIYQNLVTFNALRFQSGGRTDCGVAPAPVCGSKDLTKSPCQPSKGGIDKKKKKEPFKSMWENPECCRDPCPDILPRFDELFYKPTDKATRKYTQTWIECPEKRIVRKPVCDLKLIYPVWPKRKPNVCLDTAKCFSKELKCDTGLSDKCSRIIMPGCRKAHIPPKCKLVRVPANCKKLLCPFPAFSECLKDKVKPKHPVECFCLASVAMCDVYASIRRLEQAVRVPTS